MKSLTRIYIEYEIGEIYPENLPNVIADNLNKANQNEALKKIISLKKPTRADIHEFLYIAFEIEEENKLTKLEKLDFLLNKWQNGKVDVTTLFNRIQYFELETSYDSKSFEEFMKALNTMAGGTWVPSDEMDWVIKNLEKDLNVDNKYSEFLI